MALLLALMILAEIGPWAALVSYVLWWHQAHIDAYGEVE